MNAQTSTTKFQMTKFGLKHNPCGAQVVLQHEGRTLLGDVTGCYLDKVRDTTSVPRLKVSFFNGEPWPIDPHVLAVDVLIRREV